METKVTIPALQKMKREGRKIVGVVAWDYQIAQIAAHGFAANQHLVHGDFRVRCVPPKIHADGITHRYEIHSGAVRDLRDLVVPGDDPDDLSPFALHFLERGNRYLGLHLYLRSAGQPPD